MNDKTLAAHVLRTLALAHFAAKLPTFDELAASLGVRRADVRRTITALHHAGMVDATRLRLTLAGFVAGRALMSERLRPLRVARNHAAAA